jgi:tripartite-type tricarboxylate transporter receptor subunit TctC
MQQNCEVKKPGRITTLLPQASENAMQICSRRAVLTGLAGLALSSWSATAREQSLKVVFPFSPGGSGDAIARLFAERLQTRLGRAVIVDNRAGAGGRIGAQAVKNAAPDEETLLFASASQFSLQPHLFPNLGYDPFVDFVPVSQAATIDLALAVNSQLPVRSVGELIAWIKANPDRAIYGSPGAGTAPHFICTEFGRVTGLNLRHVAYRGTPAALPDVLAGRVPVYMAFLSELLGQERAGGIRILATAAGVRSSFLPQIATLKESGIDVDASGWYAFYAPAHAAGEAVERLTKEIISIATEPEVRAKIRAMGCEPTGTTPEELKRLQRADFERWGPVVRASGITVENQP